MEVDATSMRRNLDSTRGLVYSQAVLLALVDAGMLRDDAYRIVQSAAQRAWERGTSLRDEVIGDSAVTVPVSSIDAAFDLDRAVSGARLAVDALDGLDA
jgi:adenylosuccinate lyase